MAVAFLSASTQALNLGQDIDVLRNVAGGAMMGWVRPRVTPTGQNQMMGIAIGPPPGTSGSSRMSLLYDNANLQFAIRTLDTDGGGILSAPFTFTGGVWRHIAGVINFTTRVTTVYVDGVPISTATLGGITAGNTSNTNAKNAAIGAADDLNGQNFDGDIEDVRVYERFMSDAEILTIYTTCGKDGIWDGCRMRYLMQELAPAESVILVPSVGTLGRGASPVNGPVYSSGVNVTRRRVISPE